MKYVNIEKIKKGVKTGAFVLVIGASLSAGPVIISKALEATIESTKKEAAYNSARSIVDAAKYEYMEGVFNKEVITSGNVVDLEVKGTPATSGTWKAVDIDNDGTLEIMLKDVEINGYIINSDNTSDEYSLNVKKR